MSRIDRDIDYPETEESANYVSSMNYVSSLNVGGNNPRIDYSKCSEDHVHIACPAIIWDTYEPPALPAETISGDWVFKNDVGIAEPVSLVFDDYNDIRAMYTTLTNNHNIKIDEYSRMTFLELKGLYLNGNLILKELTYVIDNKTKRRFVTDTVVSIPDLMVQALQTKSEQPNPVDPEVLKAIDQWRENTEIDPDYEELL